jgi:hypothetical protein
MRFSHAPAAMSATFDEQNLIVSAGLVPAVGLAHQVGVATGADELVTVAGSRGANAGSKVMSLVAGMCVGADCIDDVDMLRHGAMATVFTGMRAPSTLGTFLRGFTFGHVRQLDAVASRALTGLVEHNRDLLAGIESRGVIDIDDTLKRVYGASKQGAEFGYTYERGLNAQLATISTNFSAPVIAATRLRRGAKNSSHGAVRMIQDTIATAGRCGAKDQILVRADSAYCNSAVITAVVKADAEFSMAITQSAPLRLPKSNTPHSLPSRNGSTKRPGCSCVVSRSWTRRNWPGKTPSSRYFGFTRSSPTAASPSSMLRSSTEATRSSNW